MRVFKLFLSFAILVPTMIWAAVGKLTVVKGEVAILRGGKSMPAQSGTAVEEKDTIVSQVGAAAQLVLNDGTAVSVGSKTTFKIHEYLFEEGNPSKANAKFGAIQGAFKAVTGKIGKVAPNNFKLETKTATIGIRGTRFLGVIPEKGPETIACTKGEITVTPLPVPTVTAPTASSSQGQSGGGASGGKAGGSTPASSGGGSSGSSGGSAPASSGPSAPAPAPVVVKAGEMTTVSVGAIEPPKPFTQAELKKLESAASAPAKEEKQEAKAEAKAEKSAEKQEAKKEESKTEEKKESKQEPAAQKAETKAEVKTEKVETKEAAPAPAPAPKVEAAPAPAAPPPPSPPMITPVAIPASVTDSANAANLAAQQKENEAKIALQQLETDKLAIQTAITNKDLTVLKGYLGGSYDLQVKMGIDLIFTGTKDYTLLAEAINSSDDYLNNKATMILEQWRVNNDTASLLGAVNFGGNLGLLASYALDSMTSVSEILKFSSLGRSQNNSPAISGMTSPNTQVDIYNGETKIGTVLSDETGKFTYVAIGLMNGFYSLTATVTAAAGSKVSSAPVSFEVLKASSDITLGALPVILNSANSELTNNALKVTYDGVTKYFKYTSNFNTYSASDVVFANIADLTSKLQSFTGNDIDFSLDPTTLNIHANPTAGVKGFSFTTATVGTFLGMVPYTNITPATSGGDTFTPMSSMPLPASAHQTVVLNNGNVLSIGGWLSSNPVTRLYDVNSNTWSLMANMPTGKEDFGAAVLPDGNVLVFGDNGYNYSYLYYPSLNLWVPAAGMLHCRLYFATETIKSGVYSGGYAGGVLAMGGLMYGGSGTGRSVEMYYNGSWIDRADMNIDRWRFAAANLLDGRVMAMGGYSDSGYATYGNNMYYANTTEIYNPSTNSWSMAASMLYPRNSFSATTLSNGHILAMGGTSNIEEYDPTTNSWSYKVALPFSVYGSDNAVTLQNGKVLIVGSSGVWTLESAATTPETISTIPFTLFNTVGARTLTQNDYNVGVNNGFFIGARQSDIEKVFGSINSMLFNGERSVVQAGLNINTNSGMLSGSLGTLGGYNTNVSQFDFSHVSTPSTPYASYVREDDKTIWGSATIDGKSGFIGFAALPDKINANNTLSNIDDFSSWGYWEAVTNDSTVVNQNYYSGYWVSGEPTPVAYVQQMINQNHTALYSGHIIGDTLINGSVKDSIILNNNNQMNVTVNFGAANPVNVTGLKFQTSQGWNYNNTTGFTGTSALSVNTATNVQSYSANIANGTDALTMQGKFYGPTANSTGGVVSGVLTGIDNTQRMLHGVYKARQ